MEIELLKILSNVPLAGAIAIIGYLFIVRVLTPLVNYYINSKNGVSTDMEKRVNDIGNHQMTDVNRRLDNLESNDLRMWTTLDNIKDEMSRVKEKVATIEGILRK